MLMNNKFKAQTLTGNPTGNYRCQLFASRALNMSCYFSQSARSIESRCVVTKRTKWFFSLFTFGPRGRRARSARRPRGQNVAAIALDMGQAHLWYENNTMQTIHAIQTLRTVCGFLDMGDGCCLIFNKNQLMFIVRKSITAQIKKKIILVSVDRKICGLSSTICAAF